MGPTPNPSHDLSGLEHLRGLAGRVFNSRVVTQQGRTPLQGLDSTINHGP
jgi:hypothetical protein